MLDIRKLLQQYHKIADIPKDVLRQHDLEVVIKDEQAILQPRGTEFEKKFFPEPKDSIAIKFEMPITKQKHFHLLKQNQIDKLYQLYGEIQSRNTTKLSEALEKHAKTSQFMESFKQKFKSENLEDLCYAQFDPHVHADVDTGWYPSLLGANKFLEDLSELLNEYKSTFNNFQNYGELVPYGFGGDVEEYKDTVKERITSFENTFEENVRNLDNAFERSLEIQRESWEVESVSLDDWAIELIASYTDTQGEHEIANQITKCNTIEELYDFVKQYRISDHSNNEQIKSLQRDPRENSKEIKELKIESKKTFQFVKDLQEYLHPQKKIMEHRKNITNILKMMYSGHSEIIDCHLQFDGTYNRRLDSNPGEITGDCTIDKPLPFHRPDTHNVKVYHNDTVIGSVYMLETKDEHNKRTWHIDAIQIPGEFDWECNARTLIDYLGQSASAADIHQITRNARDYNISNFVRVQEAFTKCGYQHTKVIFPEVSEKHSEWQGKNDSQVIMWSLNN